MKRRLVVLLSFALALFAFAPAASAGHGNGAHTASLKGGNEVPANGSQAAGQAIFKFAKDGSSLSYKLIVANIDDVVAAHIHCGVAGANGPVGVTLFGGGPTSDSGILSQATVNGPDAGNACAWATLGDVLAAIESDGAYVNVHTLAIPGGEIRGQIR